MVDFIMGLGLALPIVTSVGIGTVTGVGQGVSHQRKANEEAAAANPESRMIKFNVVASLSARLRKSPYYEPLDGGIVVLRDDKLWVERRKGRVMESVRAESHPFTGFFLQYPDEARVPPVRGLVSTIQKEPPMLNWVYVDRKTHEVKYSNRSGSIAEVVGPWDWTDEFEDSRLEFDEWEPFVLVQEPGVVDEEGEARWALYADLDDDGLKAKKPKGAKTLEVALERCVITDQEVNKWGIGKEGNIGFKATKEIDKIGEERERKRLENEEAEKKEKGNNITVEHKE